MQQEDVAQNTTLAGSHRGREFAITVSGATWDRFRNYRMHLAALEGGPKEAVTVGQLLAEIDDVRLDPSKPLCEADITYYLDALESFLSWCEEGSETSAAADTA